MTRLTTTSEYLVELSEDQQEVISGGLSIAEALGTNFASDDELAIVTTDQSSGPYGTSIKQSIAAANSEKTTNGNKAFAISTDGDFGFANLFGF